MSRYGIRQDEVTGNWMVWDCREKRMYGLTMVEYMGEAARRARILNDFARGRDEKRHKSITRKDSN